MQQNLCPHRHDFSLAAAGGRPGQCAGRRGIRHGHDVDQHRSGDGCGQQQLWRYLRRHQYALARALVQYPRLRPAAFFRRLWRHRCLFRLVLDDFGRQYAQYHPQHHVQCHRLCPQNCAGQYVLELSEHHERFAGHDLQNQQCLQEHLSDCQHHDRVCARQCPTERHLRRYAGFI